MNIKKIFNIIRHIQLKNILKFFYHIGFSYKKSDFGFLGKNSNIGSMCTISGPQNIFIEEKVSIASNSVLYATNAKIVIKKGFISAKGLKIATGNHERRVGMFLADITEEIKNHNIGLDKDVIINEDVWAGFNVTILNGVEIGRGCTLAAGSVITKNTPPYCIIAGSPARPIKIYWTIEQILSHEKKLYKEQERYTRKQLEDIFKSLNI